VADSSGRFRGIGRFLEESGIFFSGISHFLVHYVHKIRGIGNWTRESATGPLLSARGIGHFKIATFSRLSGTSKFGPQVWDINEKRLHWASVVRGAVHAFSWISCSTKS
jgi:hypothetical protein